MVAMIALATVSPPVGPLTVAARAALTCLVQFGADENSARSWLRRWYPTEIVEVHPDPGGAVSSLSRYFDGELSVLDALPVELRGTPFQTRVWSALRDVRAGTTSSYPDLAKAVGSPLAVRAVGAANGANPIAVIVPCHRIIGTN